MTLATLSILFASVSHLYGLPEGLLSSVCFTESGHNVSAIHKDDGGQNSLGVCQLHLSTAKWLGYQGSERGLLDPKTNTKYAALYLGHLIKRYHGDVGKAVGAYNSGSYTPKNYKYVNKVYFYWGVGK